jgi:glycosyltransferase involved in cell wall biosynthesis
MSNLKIHLTEIINNLKKIIKNAKITFIIPSINRPSLYRTINSLIQQKNPNWKAIIVFDGVKSNINITDNRFSIINIDKIGKKNNAGEVRNIAIKEVDTEWCGFVDDDDTLLNNYVELFYEYITNESYLDVILFRMKKSNRIIPEYNENNLIWTPHGNVGISFCTKTDILKIYKFVPHNREDFNLIDKLNKNKKKIMISDKITYLVNNTSFNESDNLNLKKDYYNV